MGITKNAIFAVRRNSGANNGEISHPHSMYPRLHRRQRFGTILSATGE
jgi:hypothetical protein